MARSDDMAENNNDKETKLPVPKAEKEADPSSAEQESTELPSTQSMPEEATGAHEGEANESSSPDKTDTQDKDLLEKEADQADALTAAASKGDGKSETSSSSTGTDKGTRPRNSNRSGSGNRNSSGRFVAWLALLIALLAAGLSVFLGWNWLQGRDTTRQMQTMLDEHQAQVTRLRTALSEADASVSRQLASRDSRIQSLRSELTEAEQLLDAHSRRLLSLTATTTDDWRLAEAEYLLRLANQRILTSKDANTAIDLIDAADDILLELGDPRLFDARAALAKDRAGLAAVGEYDIDGVFLELAALSAQVPELKTLVIPEFQAEQATLDSAALADENDGSNWRRQLAAIGASTWQEIKSLIVIQSIDQPVEPLLPPDQQLYLKNNLRLMLNQGQLALLDGRQEAYRQSLNTAAEWLMEFFPQQYDANKAMVEAVTRLSKIVIARDYPDVSESLLSIRAFIAEQHRLSGGQQASPEKAQNKES